MKEITIVWIDEKQVRIISCNPYDILETEHMLSFEPDIPHVGFSPEFKKTKSEAQVEFYVNIVIKIENAREIVLFGSDNRKEEFLDYLNEKHKPVFAKVIGVESSLDMTEDKIIARGRKYL